MGTCRPITWIRLLLTLLTLSNPIFPLPVQISEEQIPARANEPLPLPQLEIHSIPSDAWVYIEGTLSGSTPLILKDLSPSWYALQVQKSGYRPLSLLVTLRTGFRTRIQLELEPIHGTLSLGNVPPESRVYVAGTLVSGRTVSLPVGQYRVVVRRFGYEDIVTQITILEGKTTEIPITWKRVPFSVSRVSVTPQRINPENRHVPARINFWITSPAEITLRIEDGSGTTVWEKGILEPGTSLQQVEWDGRDQNGIPLSDGTYRLVLHFKSADTSMELTREIIVDRKIRTALATTYSGFSGLLFSPIVPALNPGDFRISSWILGQSGTSSPEASPSLVQAGISLPIGDNCELSATLSSFMEATDAPPDWIGGIGVQYRWVETGTFAFGIAGKGTYMNRPREYGFSQLGGVSLGAPMEVRHGLLGFIFFPELTLSPYNFRTLEDQFTLYGSLRGGCYLDWGEVRVGFSSVLSVNVSELRPLPIYHTGVEVHWKPPSSPFVFSFSTILIRSIEGNLIVYLGGGLGAVY